MNSAFDEFTCSDTVAIVRLAPLSLSSSCSVASDSLWPHGPQHARPPCPSPSPGVSHLHWVSDAIQPSHPLSSPSPPAFNLSQLQGLFQWVGSSRQVAKSWSFSISPSNGYSGLISLRIDWFNSTSVTLHKYHFCFCDGNNEDLSS